MKNSTSIIFLFVIICFFISCKKDIKRFDINNIEITQYEPLSDSLTMQELIYDNPEISGWREVYNAYYNAFFLKKDTSRGEYINFKRKFDDYFWEKTNRDSMIQVYGIDIIKNGYFPYINSMSYRVVDTIELNQSYGFLILKNDEEDSEFKRLYLTVFDQEKRNTGTYLVSEKYGNNHTGNRYSDKIKVYSDLRKDGLLSVHFETRDFRGLDPNTDDFIYFDSLYIRSVYDLNKHILVRTDTIISIKKKNRNEIPARFRSGW